MKLKCVRSEALDLMMHELTESAGKAFCPLRK